LDRGWAVKFGKRKSVSERTEVTLSRSSTEQHDGGNFDGSKNEVWRYLFVLRQGDSIVRGRTVGDNVNVDFACPPCPMPQVRRKNRKIMSGS
jgi:hypothetical protein